MKRGPEIRLEDVLKGIAILTRSAKGQIRTFRPKHIARALNLPQSQRIYLCISVWLRELAKKGLLEMEYRPCRRAFYYIVHGGSRLWNDEIDA